MKLIYRTAAASGPAKPLPPDCRLKFINTGLDALGVMPALVARFGIAEALKAFAKVLTSSRAYYAVLCGGKILSDGWIMKGQCSAYKIEPDAHVIGPIWTGEAYRGRGLASSALSSAVAYCKSQGASFVYIETVTENEASQRTIRAAGFDVIGVR
jgi:ribosomal protein S18 acetylase RimI-like enzyme